ncbi:MAG TPA: hypothetical protein PK417_02905 [Hyphomonas sp.]|nr:hypothetical protein [Hyphomonas sp.]
MAVKFRGFVPLAIATILCGVVALIPAAGTQAETGASGKKAVGQWRVAKGWVDAKFKVRPSGDGTIRPIDEDAFHERDLQYGAYELEKMLNKGQQKIAETSSFFMLGRDAGDFENVYVVPVDRLVPNAGAVLEAGYYLPPRTFDSRATRFTVMGDWMAAIALGAKRGDGPEHYKSAWLDPSTWAAYAVANQAVMQLAAMRIQYSDIDDTLWNPTINRPDTVGGAIFNGTVLALTKFAAADMPGHGNPSGYDAPNDYSYVFNHDRLKNVNEAGPTPKAMLALSHGWTEPWGGLESLEGQHGSAGTGPVSGMMMSLLSNAGPNGVFIALDDPFPYKKGEDSRSAKAWLTWLDTRIKATDNYSNTWKGHSQFVAERGLAGAYVTALSDLLAIPERAFDAGGWQLLPDEFMTGEYLDTVYDKHPCQDFDFSLESPVKEVTFDLPEVSSRCIRVRWRGEGYGPDKTAPPIAISVKGEGMTAQDYDAILLASSDGERTGLTIVDSATRNAVKWWTMPYRADYGTGPWMTMAFANVAPKAADTRPRKIRVSIGPGMTSGSGAVTTVADASGGTGTGGCRPRSVTSPQMLGTIASAGALLGGSEGATPASGALGGLLGLSVLAKDSPRTEPMVGAAMCTARTIGGALSGDVAEATACAGGLAGAMGALTKKPDTRDIQSFELRTQSDVAIAADAMRLPAEAEISLFDPGLGRFGDTTSVYMKGFVTFQVRSDTRLRGRVDLKVPSDREFDQGDCPDTSASGEMTFVFDLVAAMPFSGNAVSVPPATISVINPQIWAKMSPEQRRKAIADGEETRADVLSGGGSGAGGVLAGPSCGCSCEEYFDAGRNATCSDQCFAFQTAAPKCVADREVSRGRVRTDVERVLNACPSTCAGLATADPICREAFPLIDRSCKADIVTAADKACYLKLLTQEMPEPMKSQMASEMSNQLASMDQDSLKLMIRPQLEAFKEQGLTCPVN